MRNVVTGLLGLLVAAASCSTPKDLTYRSVQNFSLKKAGTKQTVLSMDVQLYNPNAYNMRLKKADMDIYLNNNRLGKVNLGRKLKVPGLDTFSMPVVLDVDLANALPNMLQLAFNSEVEIKLTGTVKAGRHGVFITIPVNYTGKQDIRQGIGW